MDDDTDSTAQPDKMLDQKNDIRPQAVEANAFADIFAFPQLPFKEWTDPFLEYEGMGARGSVARVLALATINGLIPILTIILTIWGNPYIDFAYDLQYLPFTLTFILLIPAGFLIHTLAHFLCFRALSGKGNLLAHGYLAVLSSTNVLLLFCLATLISLISQIGWFGNIVLIVGSLYLMFPFVMSLQAIHHLSTGRAITGFILSSIISVPLIFVHLYLFTRFREAIPYEIHDSPLMLHFGGVSFLAAIIITYMREQEQQRDTYPGGIPLAEFTQMMFKQKKVKVSIFCILATLLIFLVLDFRFPAIHTKFPAYSVAFLPKVDPNRLYIYTKTTDHERDTSRSAMEVWDINRRKRLVTASVPYGFLLRPDQREIQLLITNHWESSQLFDPKTREIVGEIAYLGGNNPYNPTYNSIRNEYYGLKGKYQMGFHHLVVFDGTGEKNSIDYSLIRGEIWAVAVHPSGKYLFVVGDNFIDTLDAETLEPINAMLLGGKLRDVAVSPDGKRLYVADAVWRRVRIIPSPIREF